MVYTDQLNKDLNDTLQMIPIDRLECNVNVKRSLVTDVCLTAHFDDAVTYCVTRMLVSLRLIC